MMIETRPSRRHDDAISRAHAERSAAFRNLFTFLRPRRATRG